MPQTLPVRESEHLALTTQPLSRETYSHSSAEPQTQSTKLLHNC